MKIIEQQDIQALQRIRSQLVKRRSATANQLRGLLAEYGVVTQSSSVCLIGAIPCILEDANNELSDLSRTFVLRMSEHYKRLRRNRRGDTTTGSLCLKP